MKIQMYLVSLVLCGELVSYTTDTPIQDICGIVKEGAEVSNVTIKTM
jgi:hypothetical protein